MKLFYNIYLNLYENNVKNKFDFIIKKKNFF